MNGTQAIRPGLWYSALGLPFLLAGFGLMVYLLFTDFHRVSNSMAYADVPGQMDLDLKRDLSYSIFLEQTSGGNLNASSLSPSRSAILCELHALPNGDLIPLNSPGMSTTYNFGDRSGASFREFRVPRDGRYMLECEDHRRQPVPKLRVAVGSGAAAAISVAILKGLVAALGGGVVALLIFLRVLMLRDQSKREIRALGLRPV